MIEMLLLKMVVLVPTMVINGDLLVMQRGTLVVSMNEVGMVVVVLRLLLITIPGQIVNCFWFLRWSIGVDRRW